MSNQNPPDLDDNDDDIEFVSKTQMKKEMLALQELAVYITTLKHEQQLSLPLSDDFRRAIEETRNIKKREALRRHHQYLGRLMRSEDHEGVQQAIDAISDEQDRLVRLMHVMEAWRDQLIADENDALNRFFDEFPHADRQQVRNLVRGAQQEKRNNKSPSNARKLFKLIRDLMAAN